MSVDGLPWLSEAQGLAQDPPDALVIGAGVIGLACARALQRRGFSVGVIEREAAGAGASAGNAGAFAFADIFPLARPGMIARAPFWLLDPLGPLSIRPGYAATLAPWLWRFWRASRPDRFAAGVKAQTALMVHSERALPDLIADLGAEDMLRRDGQLQVYAGAASWRRAATERAAQRAHGVAMTELIGAAALAEVQPGLAPHFTHGLLTPNWLAVSDPLAFARRIAARVAEAGGRFLRGAAHSLRPDAEGVAVDTDRGLVRAGRAIVAAGAWSGPLALSAGDPVPLDTERGYNTTFRAPGFTLRRQITFPEHGFVVTRIGERIRVGGAVEFAGASAAPNFARARAMMTKARRFLPGLAPADPEEWMGRRPSMPDSLPVIGPARASPRILYAFGHGHLGLTQAAGTAELIADMAEGRRPALDCAAYAANR